jgi:hypothetical protein
MHARKTGTGQWVVTFSPPLERAPSAVLLTSVASGSTTTFSSITTEATEHSVSFECRLSTTGALVDNNQQVLVIV